MKNKIKIYRLAMLCLLSLAIGCAKDDYNIQQSGKGTNTVLRDRTITGDEALSIGEKLNAQLGYANGLNKGESATNYGTIDFKEIRNVLDMSGKDNYTFRVLNHPESSEKVFFNLVMIQRDGYTTVMLVKYEMDAVFADAYYNRTKDFAQFSGTVSFSLLSSNDPCPPVPPNPTTTGNGSAGDGPPNPYPDQGSGSDSSLWQMYMTLFYADHAGDSANNGSGYSNDTDNDDDSNANPRFHRVSMAINPVDQAKDPCSKANTIGVLDPQDYALFDKFITTLSTAQQNWINNPANLADRLDILKLLDSQSFNILSLMFANQLTQQYVLNPGFHFDAEASFKSPAFVDFSSVSGNTSEEIEFREIYKSLMQSPKFRLLFDSLFGQTPLFNVKFAIADIPQTAGSGHIDGKCSLYSTSSNSLAPYNLIQIDKSIFSNRSRDRIATTIVHECIHAFLNIKFRNPTIGMSIEDINNMDFKTCINTYYNGFSGSQTQHSFFTDFMIPTMVEILMDAKNSIYTPEEISGVENPESNAVIYDVTQTNPSVINYDSILPWNWTNYFTHLCYTGLEGSTDYPLIYPPGSPNLLNLTQYIGVGILIFNH